MWGLGQDRSVGRCRGTIAWRRGCENTDTSFFELFFWDATAGKQREKCPCKCPYLGESQSGTGKPSESYSAPPMVWGGGGLGVIGWSIPGKMGFEARRRRVARHRKSV